MNSKRTRTTTTTFTEPQHRSSLDRILHGLTDYHGNGRGIPEPEASLAVSALELVRDKGYKRLYVEYRVKFEAIGVNSFDSG